MNPRNRKKSEATEQIRVIDWARRNEWRCRELELLHHIPNGGSRNKAEAANLKAQGVKSGVPDLCLPVARRDYHGLYIEMKTETGRVSDNQQWWIQELNHQRYLAVVCYGWKEAVQCLTDYLR